MPISTNSLKSASPTLSFGVSNGWAIKSPSKKLPPERRFLPKRSRAPPRYFRGRVAQAAEEDEVEPLMGQAQVYVAERARAWAMDRPPLMDVYEFRREFGDILDALERGELTPEDLRERIRERRFGAPLSPETLQAIPDDPESLSMIPDLGVREAILSGHDRYVPAKGLKRAATARGKKLSEVN